MHPRGINAVCWTWGQAVTRPHKIQLDQLGQEEKIKRFSIKGEPKIEVEYILEIDISKTSIQIEKDIETLTINNDFFNFFELVSVNMNVKTYNQFCVVINSARIDTLLEMKWSFMVLEYCHLRKYAFLSIEGAKKTIEIIYA